jgi:hypothetical protein
MTRPISVLAGILLCVGAIVIWRTAAAPAEVLVMDLVEALPQADRRPSADAFSAVTATLDGRTRPAILVTRPSRLTWTVDVPDDAWLRLALALREDAWQIEGDGVLFQVGVSDGDDFTELFSLMVNPFRNPEDRAWHELALDLGTYAGRTVDIIFNTRSSAPEAGDDVRGDFALWGAPVLVTH